MSNLENDIKKAIDVIKYNYFCKGKLYFNTTENIKDSYNILTEEYKSALLPTSSVDHVLEAFLYDIKDITCYDSNSLCKYFAKLKIEAFKSFTKEEYVSYMYTKNFNKEYFNFIKHNLDEDTYYFFEELYKEFSGEQILENLFINLNLYSKNINSSDFYYYAVNNYTSILLDDNYKKIQNNLQNSKIKFIDNDFFEIDKINKSFDFINFTNIYEFINTHAECNKAKLYVEQIIKLLNLLNENGKMIISYLYKCDIEQIKKSQNKRHRLLILMLNIIILKAYQIDKSNSINDVIKYVYIERNYQLIKELEMLYFEKIEIPAIGLGFTNSTKDMILVHTKRVQNR